MNSISSFDLVFLARQTFLVALISFVPVGLFAGISRRRSLLLFSVAFFFALWGIFFVIFLRHNLYIWSNSTVPYAPFRVGPSLYSICEMVPVMALTLWLPALLFLGLAVFSLWKFSLWKHLPLTLFSLILFCGLFGSKWTWDMFRAIEYSHEDTIWSDTFSSRNWKAIQVGMSKDEVMTILGTPLDNPPDWWSPEDGQMEWWVRNWSAGYFAVAWFKDNTLQRKNFWYSD